jgi:sugar phosphate isomerase/epimerase
MMSIGENMRIGLCTTPDNLELAARLGFDYVEFAVSAIEALSDDEFSGVKSKIDKSSIKAECFNVLFPGSIKLVGPGADHGKIRAYLEKAFARVKALGGMVVVFGSGRSRAFPEGIAFKQTYKELVNVTKLIGEIAAKYSIIAAIEPLNRTETNCINSLIEGAMLEADADMPSIGLLADLYHVLKENEPMADILLVKELKHTHIAVLEGRAFPTYPDKDVEAFFAALKQCAYNGTMSIEGNAKDLESDAAAALKILRSL